MVYILTLQRVPRIDSCLFQNLLQEFQVMAWSVWIAKGGYKERRDQEMAYQDQRS